VKVNLGGENETLESKISDDEPDNPRTLAGFADPDARPEGGASEEYFGEDGAEAKDSQLRTCPASAEDLVWLRGIGVGL
jgi:hypothetical protein